MFSRKAARSFTIVFCLFAVIVPTAIAANPLRSFDEIFPGIGENERSGVFSPEGLIRSVRGSENPAFLPAAGSGIDLHDTVMRINPSYIAESLLVIPYHDRTLERLDIYNALGKISDLKGRLYHSHTRDAEIPLFEDATRIESERNTRAIPDPPPARELPRLETTFIRLKDVNFGNSYYRAEMTASTYGITYKLTNFRTLSFLFFPVLRDGKFTAILYMEPLLEGMLVYSMAGADASDFISNRVDIPSAINKRLAVFIAWISDGIKSTR